MTGVGHTGRLVVIATAETQMAVDALFATGLAVGKSYTAWIGEIPEQTETRVGIFWILANFG